MDIKTLLESNMPSQKTIDEGLISKWEGSGLLDDLTARDRGSMARLLENQARQLVREASNTGTAQGQEEWSGVALPLVRRIFAEFAAKEFVSVQPMNLPSGLIFYLDFKFGTAQQGFTADQNGPQGGHPFASPGSDDSMFGVTNTADDPSGGLYGAGRFGYSINEASASGVGTVSAFSDSGSINYDSNTTLEPSEYKVVVFPTSSLNNFDKYSIRAFTVASSSAGDIATVYSQYTRLAGANIQFVVSGSIATGSTGAGFLCYYQVQPVDYSRGDFEQTTFTTPAPNPADDVGIPELNLDLQSEAIVVKTRKLKAQWTPEFSQDINAYHSIDAEAELTSMLSEYVSMEIDLEILDMLISSAPTVEYWSAVNNNQWTGSGFTQQSATTGGFYNTQGGWFQTLGTKLQKVSNKIHQKTLRGGANFLVTSPTVATVLEAIPGFAAATDGDKMEFAAGVQKVGAINNRYTVYKNPYFKENLILMGYRGSQFLETGAVFAPYVPLIMTPLVYDPVNFTPRKGVMTRYAKKVVRPEFYGKVYVHGLETI